ncbi:hypothetical protein [Streptomyces hainanensis]|uniref:Uncharacterized protein n=1 Tax=Streptomyces hainanensis TaxID=402648 RepID=A0A4R4T7P5_9ACTN|nr:hypothetical protein [Streptomyces hainanensis]TDC71404.1 hypothetical protein E1283_23555 [Streptomyces hainanensis]
MRGARLAGYLFGGATALGAAGYLVVYLYRWQWQRALLCGVLLLVVEVLLLGLAVLDRVGRLEQRLREGDRRRDEAHERLRAELLAASRGPEVETGRSRPPRFAWLLDHGADDGRRTFVFVPVLMATGVALSGVAWLLERVAGATVRPAADRRLAGRLTPLAAPPGGPTAGTAPELPERPLDGPSATRRRWPRAAGWLLAGLACVGLFEGLAELTETRPPERGTAAATSVLFEIEANGVDEGRVTMAAHQLWERCRDATAVPLERAGLTALDGGLFAVTTYPSLSEHDVHRLLGCLEDVGVDRVRLRIVGTGSIEASG